jgi:hypothetical protein
MDVGTDASPGPLAISPPVLLSGQLVATDNDPNLSGNLQFTPPASGAYAVELAFADPGVAQVTTDLNQTWGDVSTSPLRTCVYLPGGVQQTLWIAGMKTGATVGEQFDFTLKLSAAATQ